MFGPLDRGRAHRSGRPGVTGDGGRWLVRVGLNRRRWLDVDGERLRQPGRIIARYRGHMVHLDEEGRRIPDGGGWRTQAAAPTTTEPSTGPRRPAPRRLRLPGSAVDGFSRLAYTEHLADETAKTAAGFWARARAWSAAHGITRITRVVTDNGSCYRSTASPAPPDTPAGTS